MHFPFFPIAILLACLLHALAVLLITYFAPKPPEPEQKSIPVVLVESRAAAIPRANQQTPQAFSKHNTVTTKADSRYKQAPYKPTSAQQNQPSQTKRTPPTRRNINAPAMPSINTPSRLPPSRSLSQSQSVQSLFEQNSDLNQSDINQISNKNLPALSEYEIQLRKKLVSAKLYDQYHALMASSGREQIDFSVQLTLFENGAIKKAKIFKSSGIKQIDDLILRTAYNASPYAPPPKRDFDKGFSYTISISYQK